MLKRAGTNNYFGNQVIGQIFSRFIKFIYLFFCGKKGANNSR